MHFSRSLTPYLGSAPLPAGFAPRRHVFTEGGYSTREPRDHEGWDGLPDTRSDYYYKEALQMAEPLSVCRAVSGLHSLSLSPSQPGHIWLSLQFANTLLLVDGATLAVKQILQVPTTMPTEGGGAMRVPVRVPASAWPAW